MDALAHLRAAGGRTRCFRHGIVGRDGAAVWPNNFRVTLREIAERRFVVETSTMAAVEYPAWCAPPRVEGGSNQPRGSQNARHAFMSDIVSLGGHSGRNGPQRLSLSPQRNHLLDSLLFAFVSHKFAIVTASVSERDFAAKISTAQLLIRFDLRNSLTNSIALSLGEGGRNRQEQLRYAISSDIAAEVEKVEPHTPTLEAFDDSEGVQSRAE